MPLMLVSNIIQFARGRIQVLSCALNVKIRNVGEKPFLQKPRKYRRREESRRNDIKRVCHLGPYIKLRASKPVHNQEAPSLRPAGNAIKSAFAVAAERVPL